MNKLIALLTIGLLMTAGIRAPESSMRTNGFCSSGPVLEKSHDAQNDAPEFRSTASNPMTLHSGFAPSAHPFDMPMAQEATSPVFLTNMSFDFVPFPDGMSVFPRLRPPTSISL